jgi:thiol-disulfide isomerase/thioredoxin
MRESISVWLAAALCAAAAMAQEAPPAGKPAQDPAKAEPTILKIGDQVPPGTKLSTLDGKEFTFKEVRGKTVVIHFWSTVCPSEPVAEPKLLKLASDYRDKDVVVLAINANQNEIGARPEPAAFESKDKKSLPYASLRAKAEKVGMNHSVLVDHGGDVARLLAARSTPHCFVIDGKGTLAYSGALDDDAGGDLGDGAKQYVRMAVEAVRAGKPVETSTTKPYG